MDKKTIPTEHCEQVNFVNWFEYQYPKVKLMAIPNGEKRHIAVAKRLKKEGVRKGVPDLFIPEWQIWIEMKRQKGGRLNQEQKEWLDYLEKCGYIVAVCKGFDEAKAFIVKTIKDKKLLQK